MASEGEKGLIRRGSALEAVKALYDPKDHVVRTGVIAGVGTAAVGAGALELVNVATGPVHAAFSSATGEVGIVAALGAGVGALAVGAVGRITENDARGFEAKQRQRKLNQNIFRGVSAASIAVGSGAAVAGAFMEVTGAAPGAALHIAEGAGIVSAGGLAGVKYWGKRIRTQALSGN